MQLEFFLTNLGPRNYFTALARETEISFLAPPGFEAAPAASSISFPSPPFLIGLSELKPLIDQGETRTIVLTMELPTNVKQGVRKVVTLEIQPYGNNNAGGRSP